MFVYVVIFIVAFLATSLWSFWLNVRPPRIFIGATPQHYRLPAEEVTIQTADGLKLTAWFIPRQGFEQIVDGNAIASSHPSDRRGMRNGSDGVVPAIILLHGYPAEKADMLPTAQALHPYFATLLLDLRYFGKSEGRFTTLGLRERDDVKRAVDFLTERGFESIGVFGFSLGGAIGITAAAEDPRINAVAAYAPFADLETLGRETYRGLFVLKYPLVLAMRLWARIILGGDPTRPSPQEAAARLSISVLLIHSREDEQIPFHHAEDLKAALSKNSRAEFYFQERGRHGELPLDFDERLIDFFRRALR